MTVSPLKWTIRTDGTCRIRAIQRRAQHGRDAFAQRRLGQRLNPVFKGPSTTVAIGRDVGHRPGGCPRMLLDGVLVEAAGIDCRP